MLQSYIECLLHVTIKQLIYLQCPYNTVQMYTFIDFLTIKNEKFEWTITFALIVLKSSKHLCNIFLTLGHK